MPTLQAKLRASWHDRDSALCVGLDPRLDRLPDDCRAEPQPLLAFCRQVVEATADAVCAFKPQAACFHALGAEDELAALVAFIRANCPDVPIILDAKRGDIGPVAALYAQEAFDRYGVDAVTVSPYLGWDSVTPFASRPGHGAFLLCHTSNPDASWLQEHPPDAPAYLRVAERAAAHGEGALGLVVGATYPAQLASVRAKAPDLPFLVPGVGAQGGDVDAVFAHGLDAEGGGLIVNASRSVIFAGDRERADWPQAVRQAAVDLRDAMRQSRDAALKARGAPAAERPAL